MSKEDVIIHRLNLARLQKIRKTVIEEREADLIRAAVMPLIENELKQLKKKLEVRT